MHSDHFITFLLVDPITSTQYAYINKLRYLMYPSNFHNESDMYNLNFFTSLMIVRNSYGTDI